MKKSAYHLGVFGFGMAAVGQMAPGLLGDAPPTGWQFAGTTVLLLVALYCAYKAVGTPAEDSDTPQEAILADSHGDSIDQLSQPVGPIGRDADFQVINFLPPAESTRSAGAADDASASPINVASDK